MQKLCILVCGTHRSGTSAATRLINLLGADIAPDLIPAKPDNIRGFWESAAVIQIHDTLLSASSLNGPLDPISLSAGWENSPVAECAKHRLMKVIERDFSGSDTFVIKDPRISRLLPLWIDLLEMMHIEPVIVIPFRNPLEVAASLSQRAEVPLSKALLLYFQSYLETELASRKVPRLFIKYDELLCDWRSCKSRLSGLIGGHLPLPSVVTESKIDQFLTDDLRHHRFTRERLENHPGVPVAVVEMFDQMSKAAETGDDSQLRNSLDRFKAIHQQIGDLYSGLVVAEREQARVQREAVREAFEHSTSWRITAPLRWAKTTLAHFAGFDPSIGFFYDLPAPLRRNPGRHARGRIATSMSVAAGKQQQGTR